MKDIRLLGVLALSVGLAATLRAQGGPAVPVMETRNPEIDRGPEIGADDGVPRPYSVSLQSLLEFEAPGDPSLCDGLNIAPLGAASQNAPAPECRRYGGEAQLSVTAGDYRLTWPGPLPQSLTRYYESIDLTVRVGDSAGDDENPSDSGVQIIADHSRHRTPETDGCVRLVDEKTGLSLSGLEVKFYQRFRPVAQGVSDERGRFCAAGMRAGPFVAAVNGGVEYLDKAQRFAEAGSSLADIPLEGLRPLNCRVEDPAGYRRRHADAKFFFQPVAAPRSTRLYPGKGLEWQDGPEETRDGVRFAIFDSHLSSRQEAEKESVYVYFGAIDDTVLRFPFKPAQVDATCRLKFPAASEHLYRLVASCPAGRYIPPGSAVLLTNTGKASAYEAFRRVQLPRDEISRETVLPVRFATDEAPSLRWFGLWRQGCNTDAVPFVADGEGRMKLELKSCCISREEAVRMDEAWRERPRAAAAPGDEPAVEPKGDGSCAWRTPLTLPERRVLRAELEQGKGITCEQVDELLGMEESAAETE